MIVVWTQGVAVAAWLVFFAVSRQPFVPPGGAWPAVAASAVLVIGMNALLARASARGDISVVGPVFALSPVFTVIPDAVLSGTLPSPLGWLGLALSVTGTVSLSGGAAGRLRTLFARRDALDALGAAILLGFVAAVDRWAARGEGDGDADHRADRGAGRLRHRDPEDVGPDRGRAWRHAFREADLGRRLAAALLACTGAACLLFAR